MNIKNFINNEFCDPVNGIYINNVKPSTGEVYGSIPNSDSGDVGLAYKAAKKAFESWSKTSLEYRYDILMKIVELIHKRYDELALAECVDSGKPLWLTKRTDIYRAAANFKFFATAAMQFGSESHSMPGAGVNYTLRKPIGVVGCISPWNLPLYLFTWKIAPALATGNTVVAKPSEITPMTAFLFGEICKEAGLPAGVLNIVHGLGTTTGKAIVEHPGIKAISFTGGTATGKEIARIAAPMFKKLSLELGGKNPFFVFDDADLDKAVDTALNAAFTNQGQICLCGSRFYLQDGIYNAFKSNFLSKVKEIKVGNPLHDENFMGALVSEQHLNKIINHVQIAREEGGVILTGGKRIAIEGELSGGYYFEPTVIEGLGNHCRTNQEEIFGPVVTLNRFGTMEEALQLGNDTNYGLSSVVFSNNIHTINKMTEELESGIVWVNCWMVRDLRTPFGGVKSSGVGREGGFEAMRFFTEPKNICIKY